MVIRRLLDACANESQFQTFEFSRHPAVMCDVNVFIVFRRRIFTNCLCTLRRPQSELFENRRRQNLGRFIALPAAIFRPSFLPFGQTGTRCFRVQSLSFPYRHSILLCVDSPEASKLSSGLVKKLRQASTVYIFSETIMKRNRATSTVLFVVRQHFFLTL